MKSLFSSISSMVAGASSNLSEPSPSNEKNNATPKKSIRNRFGRTAKAGTPQTVDKVPALINNAANSLSQILHEIMNGDLSGDAGFQRLIKVLEGEDVGEDVGEDTFVDFESQIIQQLLDNIDHPKFVEICCQVNLAPSLFQSLRILRMIELKEAKSAQQLNESQATGVTLMSVKNVCLIFEKLCSSSATFEQVRQSLVKILTFPLSPLPRAGLHLQLESAKIIHAICKTGFTSQQVWYLHDVQTINHMVRTLGELVAISNDQKNAPVAEDDVMLKGRLAESAGMWIVAVQCVVETVVSSLSISSVLLTDFEDAKGFTLLMMIMRHSSSEHFLKVLNILTGLIFDPNNKKEGDVNSSGIPFSVLASYLAQFLSEVISWPNDGMWDNDADIMFSISAYMADHAERLSSFEYIVQGYAYAILKLFSNDPANCSQLESSFHMLASLILTIPCLEPADVVAGILTVVNYVFQCVDTSTKFLITAMCASSALLINRALDTHLPVSTRELSLSHAELIFASIEAVSRTNSKHVLSFLQSGLLKLVVTETFEKLQATLREEETMQQRSSLSHLDEQSLRVYQRIAQLITDLNALSQFAAEEIRKSGTNVFMRRVISAPSITPALARCFLRLTEDVAQVDTTHLQESLVALLVMIKEVEAQHKQRNNIAKITAIYESLWKILIRNEEWSCYHVSQGAVETSLFVMHRLRRVFLDRPVSAGQHSRIEPLNTSDAFDCLQSILRYLSLLFFHAADFIDDAQYMAKFCRFFVQTGVLDASSSYRVTGLHIVMDFLKVFALEDAAIQQSSAEIVELLLEHMPLTALHSFVNILSAEILRFNPSQRALFIESGLPIALLKVCPLYQMQNDDNGNAGLLTDIGKDLLAIIINLTQNYFSSRMLMAQFQHFLKPLLTLAEDEESGVTLDDVINMKHILEASPLGDAPYFIIPLCSQNKTLDSASLGVFFSPATRAIPANALSLSVWFRVADWCEATTPQIGSGEHRVVPIVSVESAELGEELVVELNLDSKVVSIACNTLLEGRKAEQLAFKAAMDIDITQWTHLTVSMRRTKKIIESNQLLVTVYMDGIAWQPLNGVNQGVVSNFLASEQSGEIRVGYERMSSAGLDKQSDSAAVMSEDLSIHLASLTIFAEALTSRQASVLFMRGVSYQGLQELACKMTMEPTVLCGRSLRVANHVSKNAALYLSRAELRGLEYVVDRVHEPHHLAREAFEVAEIPQPLMAISAASTIKERVSFNMVKQPKQNAVASGKSSHTSPRKLGTELVLDTLLPPSSSTSSSATVAYHARASPVRYSLLDLVNLESATPVATLGSAGSKVDNESFGHALESFGGFWSWLPLLLGGQVTTTQDSWLSEAVAAVKKLSGQSIWAQRYLHFSGYKLLAYAIYDRFKPMQVKQLLSIMLETAIEVSRNTSAKSQAKDSLLLVEPSAIRYLAMNHTLWNASSVDNVLQVLRFLETLATDEKFMHLNAMRLSVIGVPRWTLHLLASLACEGRLAPKLAFELADFRERDDPLLKAAMNLLQAVIVSDMRARDLELIAHLIASSFFPPAQQYQSDGVWQDLPRDSSASSTAAAESMGSASGKEDESVNHPFCTYVRGYTSTTASSKTMSGDERGSSNRSSRSRVKVVNPTASAAARSLSSLEVLRVYLLRLLASIYEDHMEDLRRSMMNAAINSNNNANNSNNLNSNNGTNSNGGRGSISIKSTTNAAAELAHIERFRKIFDAPWFIMMLSLASTEVATLTALLRLLGLLWQRDFVFSEEFVEHRGLFTLHRILHERVLEIPVALPLIGILFRIPMPLMLHPVQVKSAAKVAHLLNLDECAGPNVADDYLKRHTIPLLHIYYRGLVLASKGVDEGVADEGSVAPWCQRTEDLLKTTLTNGVEMSMECKRLLQDPLAIEVHVHAMLTCSNAYQEYGTKIYNSTPGSPNVVNTTDLLTSVQENYIRASSGRITLDDDEDSHPTEEIDVDLFSSTDEGNASRWNNNNSNTNSSNMNNNGFEEDAVIEDLPLVFTEDLGHHLRALIVSILTHGLSKDIDNTKVLYSFFTAYSLQQFAPACERSYQTMICEALKVALKSLLSVNAQAIDLSCILSFAKNVNNVVTLLKGFFLFDTTVLCLLEMTLELLQLCMNMPNQSGLVSAQDYLQIVLKELGMNARFLCMTALSYQTLPPGTTRKGGVVRRQALLAFVRQRLELLFCPLLEDSLENVAGYASASARFLAVSSSAASVSSVLTSSSKSYSEDYGSAGNNNNAVSSSVVTSGSVTGSLSMRGSAHSAAALFEGLSGHRSTKLQQQQLQQQSQQQQNQLQNSQSQKDGQPQQQQPFSLNLAAAQAKNERSKLSTVFWAFLLNTCFWLIFVEAEDDKSTRQEAGQVLLYLMQQRRKLLESLLTDAAPFSRQWRTAEDAQSPHQDDLYHDGFSRLVPQPSRLSPQASSLLQADEAIELTMADFSYWVQEHHLKCARVFRALDNALSTLWPNAAQEIDDCHRRIVRIAKARDIWQGVDAAEVERRGVQRVESTRRVSERVYRQIRAWRFEPVRDMSSGALAYKRTRHWLESGEIWGESPASQIHPDLPSRLIWRLNYREGPERCRRLLFKDFSWSSQLLMESTRPVVQQAQLLRDKEHLQENDQPNDESIDASYDPNNTSGPNNQIVGINSNNNDSTSDIASTSSSTSITKSRQLTLQIDPSTPKEGDQHISPPLTSSATSALPTGRKGTSFFWKSASSRHNSIYNLNSHNAGANTPSNNNGGGMMNTAIPSTPSNANIVGTASAPGNTNNTSSGSNNADDVDSILRHFSLQGILRKQTSRPSHGLNNNTQTSTKGSGGRADYYESDVGDANLEDDVLEYEDTDAAALVEDELSSTNPHHSTSGVMSGHLMGSALPRIAEEEDRLSSSSSLSPTFNTSAHNSRNSSHNNSYHNSIKLSSPNSSAAAASGTSGRGGLGASPTTSRSFVQTRERLLSAEENALLDRLVPVSESNYLEDAEDVPGSNEEEEDEEVDEVTRQGMNSSGDVRPNSINPTTQLQTPLPPPPLTQKTGTASNPTSNAFALSTTSSGGDSRAQLRSQMLKDMLVGMMGPANADLKNAKAYNIERIFGLEAQPGVLFRTKEHLFFVLGMSFVPAPGVKPTPTASSASTSNTAANTASSPTSPLSTYAGGITGLKNIVLQWTPACGSPSDSNGNANNDTGCENTNTKNTNQRNNSTNAQNPDLGVSGSLGKLGYLGAEAEEGEDEDEDDVWLRAVWRDFYEADTPFLKFEVHDIYSFFHRRHQLKYRALEITDKQGQSILFSCSSVEESHELLTFLIDAELPSSIYSKFLGMKNLQLLRGLSKAYQRLLSLFVSSLTQHWQHGELTNFEYLMYINAAAGRSYMDLTQYPVFPWILADYTSAELDFDDPRTFRDLSKPMGALSPKRAQQYLERYQTMNEFYYTEELDGAAPPFFYGTHYSCAGYVLHYLIRLQPYASMSLALQGGHFDKADRLFVNVEHAWLSASQDNLQDVRELIPEFFYLPDFLRNVNQLDLGVTQREERVSDVVLPRWANGDSKEFIRLHRMALESKYVSEHLHQWMDLVFGIKQLGQHAIDAMNVFIHITYEDEVDVDAIEDELVRTATISQINNFGQTPHQVFGSKKEHVRKIVPEVVRRMHTHHSHAHSGNQGGSHSGNNSGGMNAAHAGNSTNSGSSSHDMVLIEPVAIAWHAHLSPPLCVVGAPQFNMLTRVSYAQMVTQGHGPGARGCPVGDVRLLHRDKVLACAAGALYLPPLFRRMVKFRSLYDGVTIHNTHTNVAVRALDSEKEVTYHEQLHQRRLTCVAASKLGDVLVTGSEDMSVRVWRIRRVNHDRVLDAHCLFAGHTDHITCLDLSPELHLVVSGSRDQRVCLWDYAQQVLVRSLEPRHLGPLASVSINPLAGHVCTLTTHQLRVYHVNGDLISVANFCDVRRDLRLTAGCVVCAVPAGDWQEDAVVAVTGHKEGHIYLWKLQKMPTVSKEVEAEVDHRGSGQSSRRSSRPASSRFNNSSFRNNSSYGRIPRENSAALISAIANRSTDFFDSPMSMSPMSSQASISQPNSPLKSNRHAAATTSSSSSAQLLAKNSSQANAGNSGGSVYRFPPPINPFAPVTPTPTPLSTSSSSAAGIAQTYTTPGQQYNLPEDITLVSEEGEDETEAEDRVLGRRVHMGIEEEHEEDDLDVDENDGNHVFDIAWQPFADFSSQPALVDSSSAGSRTIPTTKIKPFRALYIAGTPMKTHRADISSIRLCPAVTARSQSTHQGGIHRAYEDSRHLDLVVGDVDGYVSRWTPQKLESLSQQDLQAMVAGRHKAG